MLILLLAAAVAAYSKDDRLTVTQDESSMEQTIERYLKTTHELFIDEKTGEKDDLFLELGFKGDDPMPPFRIVIDTQPLNKDKDNNKVIERGISIDLYTDVRVPKEKLPKALEVINDWNRQKYFSSVYVDTDGEVVFSWTLNVLEQGLATENVFDALARVQNNWQGLYPVLSPEKLVESK
jgi:hypothetical protein